MNSNEVYCFQNTFVEINVPIIHVNVVVEQFLQDLIVVLKAMKHVQWKVCLDFMFFYKKERQHFYLLLFKTYMIMNLMLFVKMVWQLRLQVFATNVKCVPLLTRVELL